MTKAFDRLLFVVAVLVRALFGPLCNCLVSSRKPGSVTYRCHILYRTGRKYCYASLFSCVVTILPTARNGVH